MMIVSMEAHDFHRFVFNLICCLPIAITVQLQETQYSISEQDGAVMVCAVLNGETERILQVTLSTQSSTAVG